MSSHQVAVDAVGSGDVEQACALLSDHGFDNEPRDRTACGQG